MNKDMILAYIEEHISNKRIDEAKMTIEQYRVLYNEDEEIIKMEAMLNIIEGNYDLAEIIIKDGLKYNILNSELYFLLGIIYEFKNKFDKAYLLYEHSLYLCNNDENRNIIESKIVLLEHRKEKTVNDLSIILAVEDNLEYIKTFIKSIKLYTNIKHTEVIVVSNKVSEETKKWLCEQNDIVVKIEDEYKELTELYNIGIGVAKKDNDIFVLKNGTILMPNTILNLRLALYTKKEIGAVGPVTNFLGYYNKVEELKDFDHCMEYALRNNIIDENRNFNRIKVDSLAILLKRSTIESVGIFDERFIGSNFYTDDLCFRIINDNKKILLCKDAFIYSIEDIIINESINKSKIIMDSDLKEFTDKWGFSNDYSTGIRMDLINFINEDKDDKFDVLEVGCACGATLMEIQNIYRNANIYGLEISNKSALIAMKNVDVIVDNIENLDLKYDKKKFKYILFGDVLEHLYNPYKVIQYVKMFLKDDGYVIASIPNVMHYSNIFNLINGRCKYEEAGILDKTHIRFFTKKEIENMFDEAEYNITDLHYTVLSKDNNSIKIIDEIYKISKMEDKSQYEAFQYIIKAKKAIDNKLEEKIKFILRRIEFDVERDQALMTLLNYIKEKRVTMKDIIKIIDKDVIDHKYVMELIEEKYNEVK